MNKTLSITRNTNAQQVFSFLEDVSHARNNLQKARTNVVPDPSIRVRKTKGISEIYVSMRKEGKTQSVASALSPSKRDKRMQCAKLMFGVASRFSVEHQLQDDQKVKAALAEIKHSASDVLDHDIKAGEMRARFETILKRPAEITTGISRTSASIMTPIEPEKKTSQPAAENRETKQGPPARKKTRRPRLKNITRPLKAAAREKTRTSGNELLAAEIAPPMPVLAPKPPEQMAWPSTISETAIFSDERSPLIDQSSMVSRTENNTPVKMPMPQDESSHAAPLPSRPGKGLLAFFSWIAQGFTNFFRSCFV
nr:hypothetical protein [uncultured Noviherbaspirillum sp.]